MRKVLRWFLRYILSEEIEEIERTTRRIVELHQSIVGIRMSLERFRGVAGLDWGFHDPGFLVIATKVNKQDRVKIFRIREKMTLREYQAMCDQIVDQYCVRISHYDAPLAVREIMKTDSYKRGVR